MQQRMKIFFYFCAVIFVVATFAWSAFALWLDFTNELVGKLAAIALYSALTIAFLLYVRPLARALVAYAVLFSLLLFAWMQIPARSDRPWALEYQRLPSAEFAGDIVTIRNVRNFEHLSPSEVNPRWETRTYDLSKLTGVDMFFSYWGSPHIAHTIASWQFEGAPPLAISIETRRENGEDYSALRGFFRQYELFYVVADERDLIRLRTNFRQEEVYLYRLPASTEAARKILAQYLRSINSLARKPHWYNAATQNCTTTIRHNVGQVTKNKPWNWRVLLNGHLPELAYMRGTINTSLPFAEMQAASNVSQRAKNVTKLEDFSKEIRLGIPERPAQRDD